MAIIDLIQSKESHPSRGTRTGGGKTRMETSRPMPNHSDHDVIASLHEVGNDFMHLCFGGYDLTSRYLTPAPRPWRMCQLALSLRATASKELGHLSPTPAAAELDLSAQQREDQNELGLTSL